MESSADARNFITITKAIANGNSFNYAPNQNGTIYYRLKVTSIKGETVYSNIISLKNTGKPSVVLLSNLIKGQIILQASENFSYRLADMSGRMIKEGKGNMGTNLINIDNSPNGIYIIRMNCNSQSITERIVKL
ncbi:MAG: T9SS type A sorting domain-containing protein [Ginsengibacter sp.]